jgi:hypothetical protein
MDCSCGNKNATALRAGFRDTENGREYVEYCNSCGAVGAGSSVDVFWDGKAEHGLPDDPKTGQPRVFGSKSEKAAFLKENYLVEAGDRVHGSTIHQTRGNDERKESSRAVVEEALRHVRSMGKDYRRQEYLKIIQESQRR